MNAKQFQTTLSQLSPTGEQLLVDETQWLHNYTPATDADACTVDSVLLAGHMHFVRSLCRRLPSSCAQATGKAIVCLILDHHYNI